MPFYRPNYNSNCYRSQNQLANFCQQDEDEDEDEDEHKPEPTVLYLGSLPYSQGNFGFGTYSDATKLENGEESMQKESNPPRVQNPFDFPTLPIKVGAKEEDETSGDETEEDREEREDENYLQEKEPPAEPFDKVLEKYVEKEEPRSINRFVLDDPIFRVLFPEVVTDPKFVISNPKLQITSTRMPFMVSLTVIHSPSQFYFQYGETSLKTLMSNLSSFYSTLRDDELVVNDITLNKTGLIVAAKLFGIWHRAEIAEQDANGNVRLFLIDYDIYGTVEFVNDVRYLLKRFTVVPVKALRGSLAGIVPKGDSDKWNNLSRKTFFDAVANQRIFASIINYQKECNVYEVDLSANVNMKNLVASMMIRQGYADAEDIDESLPFAIPLPIAEKTF